MNEPLTFRASRSRGVLLHLLSCGFVALVDDLGNGGRHRE
jgi:hypothetical protein